MVIQTKCEVSACMLQLLVKISRFHLAQSSVKILSRSYPALKITSSENYSSYGSQLQTQKTNADCDFSMVKYFRILEKT